MSSHVCLCRDGAAFPLFRAMSVSACLDRGFHQPIPLPSIPLPNAAREFWAREFLWRCVSRGFSAVLIFLLGVFPLLGGEVAEFVAKPGLFPPPNAGHYLSGELVAVHHVNRTGALRLVGDGEENRYHAAPSHRFAMLPYGTLRYHGAPAELRDIPIGTVLHGYFVLPPEGDTSIPPPDKAVAKYVPKYNHALTLEDDFSFYQ